MWTKSFGHTDHDIARLWSSGLNQEHLRWVAELSDGTSVNGGLYRTEKQSHKMVQETSESNIIGRKTEPERSMPASWPEEPQIPSLNKQFSEKLLESILTLFVPSGTDSQ